MTTLVKFDKENFPSLSLMEFSSNLQAVGAKEMYSPDEQFLLTDFLGKIWGATLDEDIDENQLLWVKASEGMLTEVFSPSLKATEGGEIILQFGVNRFLVTIDKDKEKLVCGELSGKLVFDDEEKVAKRADKVTEVKFRPGYVIFRPPSLSNSELEYKVKVSLNLEVDQKISAMNQAVEVGDIAKFASFLSLAKAGGEFQQTLKMQDLGTGEFLVKNIREIHSEFNGKPRTSWVLELEDGREVWSRGNCDLLLKRGFEVPQDKPLTLAITRVEEYKDGQGNVKYAIDCAFRLRAPYELPSIPPIPALKARPVLSPGSSTMTAVLEPKTAEEILAEPDDSELTGIPF